MSLVLTPKERARMKVVNDALKNGINPYEDVSKRHVISGVDRSLREVKIERDETVLRSNTEKVIIPDGEWGKGKHFRGIMPVSHIKGKVDETVKIGDTLFVNGVPHVECYHCKTPIRRFQIVERGGNMKADNYKITIGHWQRKDEYFVDENDQLCVRTKMIPIISQVDGCFDCWNAQDREKQLNRINGRNSIVMYPR